MLWQEKEQIRTKKKRQHLPQVVKYNEFNVGCDTLDKVQEFLFNSYRLKVVQARHYAPEGYINDVKINKLRVRGFTHHSDEREDLIRNSYPSEALQRRRKWNYLSKLEREKKEEDPEFQEFCANILKNLLGCLARSNFLIN